MCYYLNKLLPFCYLTHFFYHIPLKHIVILLITNIEILENFCTIIINLYGTLWSYRLRQYTVLNYLESFVLFDTCRKFSQYWRRGKRCTNFCGRFLTLFQGLLEKYDELRVPNFFYDDDSMGDVVGRVDDSQLHKSTQISCGNVIAIFWNEFLIQSIHMEHSPLRWNVLKTLECLLQ